MPMTGPVALRTDDLSGTTQSSDDLGLGLQGLGRMQVHLVPIKVSIVGRGDGEVETEGAEGHHADTVAHHGHFVQGGLSVEDDQVAVGQVALHRIARRSRMSRPGPTSWHTANQPAVRPP